MINPIVQVILLKVLEFPCSCEQSLSFGDAFEFWKNVALMGVQEVHGVVIGLFDLLS